MQSNGADQPRLYQCELHDQGVWRGRPSRDRAPTVSLRGPVIALLSRAAVVHESINPPQTTARHVSLMVEDAIYGSLPGEILAQRAGSLGRAVRWWA